MKILTEKEQVRLKLAEIKESIGHAREVVNIAYKRKKRKDDWGIFSFILDEYLLLDFNYKTNLTQLKLLIEYEEIISDRLLGIN